LFSHTVAATLSTSATYLVTRYVMTLSAAKVQQSLECLGEVHSLAQILRD